MSEPWPGQEVGRAPPAAAPPAAGPSFPGVVQGRPKPPPQPTPESPFDRQTDARDYEFRSGEAGFDNATKLRTEFQSLPQVKEYQTVIRQYDSALRTDASPTGDQALITAYAKMLDPTSVVREQEFATVQAGDSAIGQMTAKLAKELGMDDSGLLRPEVRARVRQNMQNLVKSYNQSYNQARDQYQQFAKTARVDPSLVVGDHYGRPFHEGIKDFWSANPAENGTVRDVEMRGGVPVGTDIEFKIDAPEGPFDRSAYLQERYGIDPNQEATATAFWNANSGNANLTVEAAREWYAGKGLAPPAEADLTRAVEDAKAGKQFGGINTEQAEADYVRGLDTVLEQRGADPESVTGAVGAKTAQGIMWGGLDEAAGIGGFLGAAVRGQNPVAGYQAERDILRREQSRAFEAHPIIGTAAELGGGILTGGAGFRAPIRAGALGRQAAAMGNPARAQMLQRQAVRGAFGAGATTGALAGFNYGEGPVGSPVGALVGAAGGAALSGGAQALAPRVAGLLDRRAIATPEQADVLAAGNRRGVTVRPADIIPEVRNQRSVLLTRDEPGSAIRGAEAQDLQDAEAAVARDVAGGRASIEREGVGATGRTALERQGNATRNEAKAHYMRAERAAGDVRVDGREAVSRLDSHISRLVEAGEADSTLTKFLEGKRAALLRKGGMTLQGVRDMRTNMRASINDAGLDVDRTEAMMLDVLDGASADIQRALSGNKRALNEYRRGDEIWRERAAFRKEVTSQLLGPRNQPKSDEAVATGITRLARDDFGRFERVWSVLEPDEQADIAATYALSAGRDGAGNFSLQRFLTSTTGGGMLGKKPDISPRAMRLMFGDDGMRAIRDLQVLARAKGEAAAQTNRSNTGNIVQATGRGARNLLLSFIGASVGDISGAVVAPAAGSFFSRMGERRATRLLLNPDFTRWLRQVPNTANPQAINRSFAKLDSIAARSPGMVADVDAFKQALVSAVNDNGTGVSRVAAEPEDAEQPR